MEPHPISSVNVNGPPNIGGNSADAEASTRQGGKDDQGHKIEQLLKAVESQLEIQQKQLHILKMLMSANDPGDGDRAEPGTKSKEESQTAASPETQIFPAAKIDWEAEQRHARYPNDSQRLYGIGENLFDHCRENHRSWWPVSNKIEFRQHWPRSLGNVDGNKLTWELKPTMDTELTFSHYRYEERHLYGCREVGNPKNGTFHEHVSNDDHPIAGRVVMTFTDFQFLKTSSLSLNTLAFILLQLSSDEEGPEWAMRFVLQYMSDWVPSSEPFRQEMIYDHRALDAWHIRYFNVTNREEIFTNHNNISLTSLLASTNSPASHKAGTTFDIPIPREKGVFRNVTRRNLLCEARSSVAIFTDTNSTSPCLKFMVLSDGRQEPSLSMHWKVKQSRISGLLVYLQIIFWQVDVACVAWEKVLLSLDEEIMVSVTDLFNKNTRRNLMFDNESFSQSERYFTALQLCRIFGNYIEETIRGLHIRHDELVETFKVPNGPGLRKYVDEFSSKWKKAMASREPKLQALLDRVTKKVEEVESLRNGLFNATSVSEASKSTETAKISLLQNQYIFVFTVATVVYLPLGFVTSLFGMHLFDTTDDYIISSRYKFWITLAIISIATYSVAALGYWLVRTGKWRKLRNWFEILKRAKKETANTEKDSLSILDV